MWKDILKGKGHSVILSATKFINEIMADGEKRTPKEILDEMWNIVESHNVLSPSQRVASGRYKYGRLTGKNIPTIMELKSYLAKNYSSGIFHNETGEELPKTTKQSNATRKYYR